MNFLVDAQLPPALARWIVSQGHQATHVFDIGLQTADDPVIWERARKQETVIISKDEDFVERIVRHRVQPRFAGLQMADFRLQSAPPGRSSRIF